MSAINNGYDSIPNRYIDWILEKEIRHFSLKSGSEWIKKKTKSFLPTAYTLRGAGHKMFKFWNDFSHFWNLLFAKLYFEPIILGIRYLIRVWMKSVFTTILNGILDRIQYTNLHCLLPAHCKSKENKQWSKILEY